MQNQRINLSHKFGNNIFYLYDKFHKKIKNTGHPIIIIFLIVGIITILTLELTNQHPLVSYGISALFYFSGFLWAKTKLTEFYNIKFRIFSLMNTDKYINYIYSYSDILENKIYYFKTNMTLDYLKSNLDKIEMVLESNINLIKHYGKSKCIIEITTNEHEVDNRYIAKNGYCLEERLTAAFNEIGINIKDTYEKNDEYKDKICFNAKHKKVEIENTIPEIEHLTALSNLKVYSNFKTDFKIIIKKPIRSLSFKSLLINEDLRENNIIVGSSESKIIKLDVRKIYHSIIGGSTGGGKSNLSHVIISSVIKSDLDISLFLFDPKKSELKRYRDIKRVCYTGNKTKILEKLKLIVNEMDRRNEIIENDKFVNNLETYNKAYPDKIGYILVFIEEISDLMLSSDKEYNQEFQDLIIRLSQLGRSTGIRLFLSTQYPKAEILPTLIKSNCLTRFGFSVSNSTESSVIMDSNILNEVNKAGEMILKLLGEYKKIQVPHLEDKHIIEIVEYLEQRHNKKGKYPLSENFISQVSKSENGGVEAETHDTKVEIIPEITEIQNTFELLDFYKKYCKNEVFTLNKTVELIDLGRTKTQELRSELINNGDLRVKNNKTYLANKHILSIIK